MTDVIAFPTPVNDPASSRNETSSLKATVGFSLLYST